MTQKEFVLMEELFLVDNDGIRGQGAELAPVRSRESGALS